MPTSPYTRTGIVLPIGSDPDQVPADLKRAFDQGEVVHAVYMQSTYASRPAPSVRGRFHSAQDTGVLSYDTGSAWVEYGKRPSLVGTPPSSPYDGQEILLRPASAQPEVLWHMQFSTTANRWLYRAGQPLSIYSASSASWGLTTYVGVKDLLSVPYTGDYSVTAGCQMDTNGRGIVVIRRTDTPPADELRIVDGNVAAGERTFTFTDVPAGRVFGLSQRLVTGNSMTSSGHSIAITPTRISA